MPMRGNLPVKNYRCSRVRLAKPRMSASSSSGLLGSPDLEVVLEFAAIGLLLSLCV